MAERQIHGLAPMLEALRIKQVVSLDECQALLSELFAATGGTPPVGELSGNQWCALVNLALARCKTPNDRSNAGPALAAGPRVD